MADMHGIVNHGFVPDCAIDIQEDKETIVTEETSAKEKNEWENENDKDHNSMDTKIAENFIDNTDMSQHKEFIAQNETVLNENNILNENNDVKSFIKFEEINIGNEMSETVKDKMIDLRDITSNVLIKVEHDKQLALEDEAFDLKDKPSKEHIKLKVDEALDLKEKPSTENLKFEENESLNFTETPSNDHIKLKDVKLLDLKENLTNRHDKVEDLDVIHKNLKPLYKSFNEKHVRFLWGRTSSRSVCSGDRRQDGDLESNMKPSTPELSRSQYSLVSTGELTAEALQVWLGLPKKIKYDPELAPFRQHYEKKYGKSENVPLKAKNGPETKRLPLVKSAPHLNNNIRIAEDVYVEGKQDDVEIQVPKGNGSGLHCGSIPKKPSKFVVAKHYIKMTLLLACWVFFTLVFLMYNEKEEIFLNSSVNPGEVKLYMLNVTDSKLTVKVKLSGPFITEQAEEKMNSSEFLSVNKMVVWLEKLALEDEVKTEDSDVTEISKFWTIVLQDDDDLDFCKGERRSSIISLASNQTESNRTTDFALRMRTTASKTVPFTMSYTLNPLDLSTGVIYACILLCGLYVLIIFEVINRTMAAVLISTTSLATLALVGERPTLPQLVSWLDMETLLLLFSMMLLVAIMAETGMFDFLAVFTFEVTKGKLWPLITLLCIITALLSTFLDNVTTVLLMAPVTIRLCEVMDLDPVPILMSMVLFSNIGGTATPVGDPPNVIIASNKNVVQAGINFTNFTMHMTLGILVVCVQTYFQLRFIYRDTNKLRLNVPREIQDLRHQISIWRRAIESLPHLTKDQHVVRERLERKINKLNVQLETMIKESNKRVCPKDTFQSTLDELKQKYKIRDKMLLLKSTVAISFVVAVFFLHSIPELNRVSLGWTALLGAILLLTLADREDLEPILHRVEWSTLLFFASLFVLMEALSKLGLIEFIGGLTESLIFGVDEKARLAVALLLMLWVSGLTSAFVDNIPLTTMMVRVVIALGSNPNLNLPMAPLIWALSFGACLGGNGTLIGASANVVCAGVAEQHGYRFTFMQFFKVGFPVMIGHLIVASGYLLLCHCVFTWH